MSSNILSQLQVPERSRSCIGLSTPLTSRNSLNHSQKLYRSLSFNSPGSMDLSLDDNITELNQHMYALEEKITSIDLDRRYNNTRTEKAIIQNHCLNLEDKLLDSESRFSEKIAEEQRRYKDLQARMQREIQLLAENKAISLRTLEEENERLREDNKKLRATIDKKDKEIKTVEEELREVRGEMIEELHKVSRKQHETAEELRKTKGQHSLEVANFETQLDELNDKLRLRKTRKDSGLLEGLQSEISVLREANKQFQEANEELQGIVFNHSGGERLCNFKHCQTGSCNLAAELEAFVSEQADITMSDIQEENSRLKKYLESLLLKIIGHYPQMLEIKNA